jgi:sigma-E factor negative regulatory protein RseA
MSEQIREQISAFLDGELPETEAELLLKRMTRDSELRDCFGRYALIAEVVRDPKSRPLPRDFAQRVNCLIDGDAGTGEPAVAMTVTAASGIPNWWRPIAGAAIAAGVAAIAVLALERRAELSPGAPLPTVAAVSGASAPALAANSPPASSTALVNGAGAAREAVSYTVPAAGVPAAGLPAMGAENAAVLPAARLTNYVFAHSKYSSALGQRNVLSGLVAEQPSEPQFLEDGGAGLPGGGLPGAGLPGAAGLPASARLPSRP